MKIQITNTAEVNKAIGKIISVKVFPQVLKSAQLVLQDELKELLVDSFQRTLVIRSLQLDFIGDELRDVPAHLGLSDSDSVDIAYKILDLIKYNFVFNIIQKIDNGAIGFRINIENLLQEIRNLDTSESDIPWMDWLLDGGNADAEIWFVKKPLSSAQGDEYSRSGRAIMREFGGNGFWDIDEYHRFVEDGESNNFVEEALNDQTWRNNARDLILNYIINYFKNNSIKV